MDPPFHQLRQTSRAKLMVSLIELSRFEGENVPHMAHHTPLFSQRPCSSTKLHGHHISAKATTGTAPFRRKATPHTGEPNILYHDGSLITSVALQGQVLLRHCLTRIHSTESLLERKGVIPNTQTKVPWIMTSRNA